MKKAKINKSRFTQVAKVLKVLSDSNRLLIVDILGRGPLTVNDLAQATDIEQSLLSHHLKVLKNHGWLRATKHGREVLYQRSNAISDGAQNMEVNLGCCIFKL